jgi:hypothetical protein
MEWPNPTVFDARNVAPWVTPTPVEKPVANAWTSKESQPLPRPDFADDEELKKAFGIELGRGQDAFNAGMAIFDQAMPKALWASVHWAKDPIVIASRDAYVITLKKAAKPLDKEELLAEVLEGARSSAEDRDRIQFLKLYSDIAGFTGKIAIDASTNNNTTNNTLTKIVLVKGSQEPLTIQNKAPDMNNQSKIQNALPTLKLVGGLK